MLTEDWTTRFSKILKRIQQIVLFIAQILFDFSLVLWHRFGFDEVMLFMRRLLVTVKSSTDHHQEQLQKEVQWDTHTLYYWECRDVTNVGHISLKLKNGVYISHWPIETPDSIAVGKVECRHVTSLSEDVRLEGRRPDGILQIPPPLFTNTEALGSWWKGNCPQFYDVRMNNCAHAVAAVIKQGLTWTDCRPHFRREYALRPEHIYYRMRDLVWLYHLSDKSLLHFEWSSWDNNWMAQDKFSGQSKLYIYKFVQKVDQLMTRINPNFSKSTAILQSIPSCHFFKTMPTTRTPNLNLRLEINDKFQTQWTIYLETELAAAGLNLRHLWLYQLIAEIHVHLNLYENVYNKCLPMMMVTTTIDEQKPELKCQMGDEEEEEDGKKKMKKLMMLQIIECLAQIYVKSIKNQKLFWHSSRLAHSIFFIQKSSLDKFFKVETTNQKISLSQLHMSPLAVFYKSERDQALWTSKDFVGSRSSTVQLILNFMVKRKQQYSKLLRHLLLTNPEDGVGMSGKPETIHQKQNYWGGFRRASNSEWLAFQNRLDGPHDDEECYEQRKLDSLKDDLDKLQYKQCDSTTVEFLYGEVQKMMKLPRNETLDWKQIQQLTKIRDNVEEFGHNLLSDGEAQVKLSNTTINQDGGKELEEEREGEEKIEPIMFNVDKPIKDFIGREDSLLKLYTILHKDHPEEVNKIKVRNTTAPPHFALIVGTGGIGKTEAVKKYVEKYQASVYAHVSWINGESFTTMKNSFIQLATHLNIPVTDSSTRLQPIEQIVVRVYTKLLRLKNGHKSLVIFDNVVDHFSNNGMTTFIPFSMMTLDNVHFVVTSKYQFLDPLDLGVVLDLPCLSVEESIKYINENIHFDAKVEEEHEEGASVKVLAELLGGLPLLLRQAVHYIDIRCQSREFDDDDDDAQIYTISSYIADLNNFEKRPMEESFQKISATWTLSWERIKNDPECGQMAARIVAHLSFLASNDVPVDVLLDLVVLYSDTQDRLKDDQVQIQIEQEKVVQFNRSVMLLEKFSLIKISNRQKDSATLSMHGEWQRAIRFELKKNSQLSPILEQLAEKFEKPLESLNGIVDERILITSLLPVWAHYFDHVPFDCDGSRHEVITTSFTSRLYTSLDDYRTVGAMLERLHQLLLDNLGDDNSRTIDVTSSLAVTLRDSGQYEKSMEMFQMVYAHRKGHHGEGHSSTLDAKHGLAENFSSLGHHQQALNLLTEILDQVDHLSTTIRSELDDDDDLSSYSLKGGKKRLEIERNIGGGLCNLKRYEEAMLVYEKVGQSQKILFGDKDPETIATKEAIMMGLRLMGRMDEAIRLGREMMDSLIQNPESGRHDKPINTIMSSVALNLADLLLLQEECLEEALELIEKVYRQRQATLGDHHRDTMTAQVSLAKILAALGHHPEADLRIQNVYQNQRKFLGNNHVDTMGTLNDMVDMFVKMGQTGKAHSILVPLYEDRKKKFGLGHPDLIKTGYNLATVLESLCGSEVSQEALIIFEDLTQQCTLTLGENHPRTLDCKSKVASILFSSGDERALSLLHSVYLANSKMKGERHTRTIESKWLLAVRMVHHGLLLEPLEMIRQVHMMWTNIFGISHARTIKAKKQLAELLFKCGRLEQAQILMTELQGVAGVKILIRNESLASHLEQIRIRLKLFGDTNLDLVWEEIDEFSGTMMEQHPKNVLQVISLLFGGEPIPETFIMPLIQTSSSSCDMTRENLQYFLTAINFLRLKSLICVDNDRTHNLILIIPEHVATTVISGMDQPLLEQLLKSLWLKLISTSMTPSDAKSYVALCINFLKFVPYNPEPTGKPMHEQMTETIVSKLVKLEDYCSIHMLLDHLWKLQTMHLGATHNWTLATHMNLAVAVQNEGNFEQALSHFENIYHQRHQEGDEVDFAFMCAIMHNMMIVLNIMKRYPESIRMSQLLIEKQLQKFGNDPRHPSILDAKNNLAITLKLHSKLDQALETWQQVYEGGLESIGADKLESVKVGMEVAHILYDQEKYGQALMIYEGLLQTMMGIEEQDEDQHEFVLHIKTKVANSLVKVDRLSEALRLYQEIHMARG